METSVDSDQLASDEHLKNEICFFIQDTGKQVLWQTENAAYHQGLLCLQR